MKTIFLMRHAKSDWSNANLADFDRPLTERGQKDAPRMGEALADFNLAPDLILASPARRARETAELVADRCGHSGQIRWENAFYGGSAEDLLAALRRLPAEVSRPLLVGHNPTMEETAAALLGGDAPDSGWAIRMPTAALVCLEAYITDWDTLEPGDCILRWFLIPKLVKALQA